MAEHALGLAGVRLYRCNDCGKKHHGLKWLKLLAPVSGGVGSLHPRRTGGWKQRYLSWRLREGRHAHKTLVLALVLLAAVGGFFLYLWNSSILLAG